MTATEFAQLVRAEKDAQIALHFTPGTTLVGRHIDAMALTPAQHEYMRLALDAALTDAYYTLLMALDGAASLEGVQQLYDLRDESGNRLTGKGGCLDAAAYEVFHGDPA